MELEMGWNMLTVTAAMVAAAAVAAAAEERLTLLSCSVD
jgi:hypothetical protein